MKYFSSFDLLSYIRMHMLKEGTVLKDKYDNIYKYMHDDVGELTLFKLEKGNKEVPDYSLFVDNDFEVLEIPDIFKDFDDIDNIEEFKTIHKQTQSEKELSNYINNIILPALKELNYKIREEK